MTTATKDMWVANLIEPWRGDSNSMSVTEFFESIDEAAEMGRLTVKDKVHLAKLKLRGIVMYGTKRKDTGLPRTNNNSSSNNCLTYI